MKHSLTSGLLASLTFFGTMGIVMAQEKWPDLPAPIKNGISARINDTLYVGLGTAGKGLYALNLKDLKAGWVKKADYSGPNTNGAASAASNGKIYIFSGNGLENAQAKSPIIFDTVNVYDPASDSWAKLDVKTPVGLSGAKALGLADGRIVLVGGYNKELFDKYLSDVTLFDKAKDPDGFNKLVNAYMGMEPKGYKWNTQVLSFDPAKSAFTSLGENPFIPNCDSALVAQGNDTFMLISGEMKPGLRTPQVKSVTFKGNAVTWSEKAPLPALEGEPQQEGIAGAYAGQIGETVLAAGGANFMGARAAADGGKWFAHEGLKKLWRSDVYALKDGKWAKVGDLPRGLGYGASFSVDGGVLIVGGEDSEGKARSEVFLIGLDGQKLSVEN